LAQKALIFVSCGQFTQEERDLGHAVVRMINERTGFEGYFADNQSTLEALTSNILERLDSCAAFIGIMHNRGRVQRPSDAITRASVWIEQEIAIMAFRQQVLGVQIKVQLYVHGGVALEGIREKLLLNPTVFHSSSEVLVDLPWVLQRWTAEGLSPGGLHLTPVLEYELLQNTGSVHGYSLEVLLKNSGTIQVPDYRVDVQFPSIFLEEHLVSHFEVRSKRTSEKRFFSATHQNNQHGILYPGDQVRALNVPYTVDNRTYERVNSACVTVDTYTGNRRWQMEFPLRDLQKF
jgi:hypothetical protein